ncbi:hypothetical protein LSH36_119g08041 [Paralvinella palmiformis]|uniref:Peroxisome biogenesis factor 2 n=1 Tax=Paralvinella palmiformis TaxID=53620 RepID=A0AAD9JXV6_9ANNE|nr:hypothetical protein LSH36_119g08041 [Paralvinella palmiformis]
MGLGSTTERCGCSASPAVPSDPCGGMGEYRNKVKYTVNILEATVGQKLLELRYKNANHPQGGSTLWMSPKQKWTFAICLIGGSWLQERKDDVSVMLRSSRYGNELCKILDWLLRAWKVAALVNFLVFLTRGHYLYLMERLLGIRSVFPSPQGVRQIGFEYMDRELLWHGFAVSKSLSTEFLFFILPLINFNKVKNFLTRHLLPSSNVKSSSTRTDLDYKECAVCGLWPYNPQEIGCRHIFCYYCIKSNYAADGAYCCPVCGQNVPSAEHIKRVEIGEEMTTS